MLATSALLLSLIAAAPSNSDPGASAATGSASKSATAKHADDAAPANPGAAYKDAPSVPAAAAAAPVAAAEAAQTPLALDAPSHSGSFPIGSMVSVFLFGICGAAALIFMRKKQAVQSRLQIVETHSLGGRRALIVAQLAGETLLIGSSESGIALLSTRPGEIAPQTAHGPIGRALQSAPKAATAKESIASALSNSWLGRLSLARDPSESAEPSFEEILERDAQSRIQPRAARPSPVADVEPALLRQPLDPMAESAEDTELRRKLAAGRSGRIA